jgi:hypothetical protein
LRLRDLRWFCESKEALAAFRETGFAIGIPHHLENLSRFGSRYVRFSAFSIVAYGVVPSCPASNDFIRLFFQVDANCLFRGGENRLSVTTVPLRVYNLAPKDRNRKITNNKAMKLYEEAYTRTELLDGWPDGAAVDQATVAGITSVSLRFVVSVEPQSGAVRNDERNLHEGCRPV